MKRLIILIILIVVAFAELPAQDRRYLDALDEKYTSVLFRGHNAYRMAPMFDPIAVTSLNVVEYMQGRVPGLTIHYGRGLTPVLVFRQSYPALFLNEVRVDALTLSMININEVAYIKVLRQPFIGVFGSSSAIAVYTRDGDE